MGNGIKQNHAGHMLMLKSCHTEYCKLFFKEKIKNKKSYMKSKMTSFFPNKFVILLASTEYRSDKQHKFLNIEKKKRIIDKHTDRQTEKQVTKINHSRTVLTVKKLLVSTFYQASLSYLNSLFFLLFFKIFFIILLNKVHTCSVCKIWNKLK